MFLRKSMPTFTENYSAAVERLKQEIETADAIVIGAGAGLSTSAGMSYGGERFEKYFSDFRKKYGIQDMYSGGFYPYETLEEYWAWWSRHIMVNRYEAGIGKPYCDLLAIVRDKDYLYSQPMWIISFSWQVLIKAAVFTHRETMDCGSAQTVPSKDL